MGGGAVPDAAALHRRLHLHVRDRRADRDHVRGDPVRPAGDGHLLRHRPLPLHHLRGRRLPDLRRHVLLVPEGHREALLRAARADQLLDPLRRDEPPLLPDAHRRPARDAAAGLHVPGRPRLGRLQPGRDDRRLHHRWPGSCFCSATFRQLLPRREGGARPVARADARVDDQLAAARVQLRGHPEGLAAPTRTGTTPTARRTAASSSAACSSSTRGTGSRRSRRSTATCPRWSRCRTSRRGRSCSRSRSRSSSRCSCSRSTARPRSAGFSACVALAGLALARAAGGDGMSGYADVRQTLAARRGPPSALLGMAILIASEATLFAALIGTYFYLRFETAVWPPRGVPEPEALVPIILVAMLALTSIPVHLAWRAVRARDGPARPPAPAGRARRPGRLLRLRGARLRRPDSQHADHARTPTPRSTTRCSGADHAHVFVGPAVQRSGCSRKLARRAHPLPGERHAGDRLVLALRQRAHDRRAGVAPLGARMSLRTLGILQWVGLLLGRASGRRSTSSASGLTQADCGAGGAALGDLERPLAGDAGRLRGWPGRARRGGGGHRLRPHARRRLRGRARRGGRDIRRARLHFFAAASIAANTIFLMIILLDGVASLYQLGCRQS